MIQILTTRQGSTFSYFSTEHKSWCVKLTGHLTDKEATKRNKSSLSVQITKQQLAVFLEEPIRTRGRAFAHLISSNGLST